MGNEGLGEIRPKIRVGRQENLGKQREVVVDHRKR